ncbi:ester cyclase [Methanosarcina sp. MSH10X1]|uniref:ester cyclase n=1 Tax=Methanosarcina sp. MSH10X1 TaxID=2507075 RepID=UPI000FFBBB80|nr:ester cyclase [Methanosarcina sp. MSH10X1]RXA20775.1 ester cyclase [Methanosarcina sp. MSH10X1]
MYTEENKAIVCRFFEEGPSKGNINAADELLSPDFSMHVPLPASSGIEGINEVITTCRAAFEHLNVTIEDMVAEGDKVVARFTARGVHKGNFMNLPATGKPVTMTGIEIFRIKDGKIAELWGEVNLLGLMQQLGIFPVPGQQD